MNLKLFSVEFVAGHIQLTYTDDGQAATQTGSMLVVRLPVEESFNRSLNVHQQNIMERLHAWAEQEFERIRTDMQGHR